MKFIHSADWQLGARFSQFGEKGAALREARLTTLQRTLEHARTQSVDAFLIAGDLFEDNQVGDDLVRRVVDLFSSHASLPIFLLPGNHDPFTGPDCVWQRAAFAKAGANVRVLRQADVVDLGGAFLVASPLHQKKSTVDPSLKLAELAKDLPRDAITIGMTHGALAIEGKHQANDFPIALNAASRAGLDYLAIGHWHGWLADLDDGRIVMPGTPEPEAFHHEQCGVVAVVEISASGAKPRVSALPVATLKWREFALDLLTPDASRATVEQQIGELTPASSVVRVRLTGSSSPVVIAQTRLWLERTLQPFLASQIADGSTIALSEMELRDLEGRHPILAQVLADIEQMETLATGRSAGLQPSGASPLSLTDARTILDKAKIDIAELTPEHFSLTRQVLLQALQEAAS